MEIIEYFTSKEQDHWLEEIKKSDWGAGQYLHQLLSEGKLKDTVGETALVLMLVDQKKLVSFCTYAPLDDIRPTELTPWIGFVYTFPEYRGHHYVGQLIRYAEGLATIMGKEALYISTEHTGLYEKYGYEFFELRKDIDGIDSRIYKKVLNIEGPEKEKRMQEGGTHKSIIVADAKRGINPIAYCGFSCNHCFLGAWCGGCRSVFNCCSFGTMFENGKCSNSVCCKEKKIEGCYECDALENCKKGFYADGNDGAIACKAQAMFIKNHGTEEFLSVHEKLKQEYKPDQLQKLLDEDLERSILFLESKRRKQ